MSDRQCEYVEKIPVYAKTINGMLIDRSEWETDEGAFVCYRNIRCKYITDVGETLCPRHKLERENDERSNGTLSEMQKRNPPDGSDGNSDPGASAP